MSLAYEPPEEEPYPMHVLVTQGGRLGTLCGLDLGPDVAATAGGGATCHDCEEEP